MRPRRIRRGGHRADLLPHGRYYSFNAATPNSAWRTCGPLDLKRCDDHAFNAATPGPSFNAATPNSAWRTTYTVEWDRDGILLQCGHAEFGVEDHTRCKRSASASIASMRPRRIRRGGLQAVCSKTSRSPKLQCG